MAGDKKSKRQSPPPLSKPLPPPLQIQSPVSFPRPPPQFFNHNQPHPHRDFFHPYERRSDGGFPAFDSAPEERGYAVPRTTDIYSKVNSIAVKLLLEEAENGYKKGNFACSPWSLESILSMIAAGAKGQTLEQLLGFLGFKSMEDLLSSRKVKLLSKLQSNPEDSTEGLDISLANGVWVDKWLEPILPSYQKVLKDVFITKAETVDFGNEVYQVSQKINSWVNKKTKGLIQRILEPGDLTKEAALVLANAIYFKGLWKLPFDAKKTKEKEFHLINGDTVSVPFMTSTKQFKYGSYKGFKILQIPYKSDDGGYRSFVSYENSNKLSMYIFLPNQKNELQNLLEKFHSDHALFEEGFNLSWKNLDALWIPKFEISYKFEAIEAMKEMGLKLPFEPMNKELTGIVGSRPGDLLYVSRIFQKSCIKVDERGTEASAATLALCLYGCSAMEGPPPPPTTFVADHPFMFMIRDDISLAVFFIGLVLNPGQLISPEI